ncbi:MAG: 3'(2'),5'-bisphosphate nucleotidase [Chloroflexi bacterium]|nr:MAG: 3'(2'),5'-bisphosphate nucleotidase [Chloroflexota bacterium]MBL1194693.1 3'(2'),5'-bisphosphate nucleotidase [Chloroflexota bacterium]NOH11985.1 3'(2'),5'-bisphosphate nucleotidase [Chloroflexota bacterium]
MLDTTNPQLQFALDAVRQASHLVKQVQAEMVSPALEKQDRSPVTVADFAAQALVAHNLQLAFPDADLVGEEDAASLRTDDVMRSQVTAFVSNVFEDASEDNVLNWIDRGDAAGHGKYWTLDPIDGTKGFLRGQQYCVALALIEDGQVQVGVLGCPNLSDGYTQDIGGPGSLLAAVRGQGAWVIPLDDSVDMQQIKVSEIASAAEARFLRSFEAGHTNVSQLDVIAEKMGVEAEPVRLDSQAKYAILASGAGDLIFRLISPKMPDYKEKIWDQAAGSLVLEEAGGKITDLDGKPLDFTQGRMLTKNRGVLASNALLHDAALEAIHKVGA